MGIGLINESFIFKVAREISKYRLQSPMTVQHLEVYIENLCPFLCQLSKKVVLLFFFFLHVILSNLLRLCACVMIIQYSKEAFEESARRCGLALRSAARLL